ncbi:hypothetical protein Q0Z83_043910 [Actinoplanes sichuanensis]|uniref:Uncharacterized protein n=1 Tax=Actinoplanes sichuanensis TaxID=512349 RepID=A0ABW4AUI1_9ACTN|nr:hypothetical protein [Actinoplanes sichuanensis]BEL06200.1 hypothetical protein Q0Z83_043910 [Actinoplanes sichuanensis]
MIMKKLVGVTVGVVFGTTVVFAAPAHADINRFLTVYRSCGTNVVSNGGSNGNFWAQTAKDGGSCQGILSVAMRANDGYQSPRVYGSRDSAYTQLSNFNAVGSIHWGCNSCSPTVI